MNRRTLIRGSAGMMPGLGRPAPSRFPYPDRPVTAPGVGPGQANITRTKKLIITGPNGQFLAYSTSTPQPDALVASFTVNAIPDGAGNITVPGWVAYYSFSGIQYAEQMGGGEIAIWTTNNAHQAGVWGLLPQGMFFQPSGLTQIFSQPGQYATLNGNFSVPNGAPAQIQSTLPIFWANGAVTEDWQSPVPTLINGWANAAGNVKFNYRRVASPPNNIEIIGTISAAAATNIIFFTLPASHIPATQQGYACGATGGVGAAAAPFVQCDTNGNLTIQHATIGAADSYIIRGSLDLTAT